MKAALYDIHGKKKKEVELPSVFGTAIREDVVAKCFEAFKRGQAYGPGPESGKKSSASGTISHQRHDWKGHYGKGISRAPRKTMWRRGTQFMWVGAEVSGARGGRRAHPPKMNRSVPKINRKELEMAFNSALAATANSKIVGKRYESISGEHAFPFVVETVNEMKTKNFISMLKGMFGHLYPLVLKDKVVRAGKGKARGRRYKSNAGLLLIVGSKEKIRVTGVDVRTVNSVSIVDLYPLGRLTLYTEKALEELQ